RSTFEDLADAQLALGDHEELIPRLRAFVDYEPLRERARAQLMLALYRAGRQSDALAEYRAARETLVDGIGIEPGPALQALERSILQQDESLAAPSAPRVTRRVDLPAPPTPLLGRESELTAAVDLLRSGSARLLTLTGPGGIGKTRLAIEVARAVARKHGAVFVDLSQLSDSGLVAPTIANALRLSIGGPPGAAAARWGRRSWRRSPRSRRSWFSTTSNSSPRRGRCSEACSRRRPRCNSSSRAAPFCTSPASTSFRSARWRCLPRRTTSRRPVR